MLSVPKSDAERRLQVSIAKDYLIVYATVAELIEVADELIKLARTRLKIKNLRAVLDEE